MRACAPARKLRRIPVGATEGATTMKRLTPLILGAILAAVLAAGALGSASAPRSLAITIRHQTHHCHTWAVGSGAYKASLSVKVARGGSIRFTNDDVMPHKLVKLSG